MNQNDPEYRSVRAVADELGVHWRTVHRIINRGDLPAYRVGQQIRVAAKDLDEYLRRHRVRAS